MKFLEYDIQYNRYNVMYRAGPRMVGPHKVFDHWDVGPPTVELSGPCTVRCEACGAEWPEGDQFPVECEQIWI